MAGNWTNGFYDSTAWLKCRHSFIMSRIAKDGGLCQMCHRNLGDIVHHIIHLTPDNINDPEISLNHDKLMFLCLKCHNKVHDGHGNKIAFDDEGNVFPLGK